MTKKFGFPGLFVVYGFNNIVNKEFLYMKWFIMSDIHGSETWCKRALAAFEKEKCDRIIILGDLLYHGPRNDLPDGYAPKKAIELLSEKKELILSVRGNCEAEVDQMVLPFPVLADYAVIDCGNRLIYLTHGHVYNKDNPLPVKKGSVVLSGHTHVPEKTEKDGVYYLNPGSVSIPKQGSAHSYMTFDGKTFAWKDMNGNEYDSLILQ